MERAHKINQLVVVDIAGVAPARSERVAQANGRKIAFVEAIQALVMGRVDVALHRSIAHHRAGVIKHQAIAIVASLLRLQANRLADPEAARAVHESQQRIEAMSLLHQSLYQTDDVRAVDMRRYVAGLVQSLSTAYSYTAADFDLALDVVPLQLEVDVAVPLGLVLNELITNAFKCAVGPAALARPSLRVALKPESPDHLLLEVQDNGPGFDPVTVRHGGSFGQRLLTALVGQLGGNLAVEVTNGTYYQLSLPVHSP